jgi:hypothetical protein
MKKIARQRRNCGFDVKAIACILVILATFVTICYASGSKLVAPEGYFIVRFHEHVSDEDIKDFVDRYSKYELRLRRVTAKWMNIYSFWYNEKLIGLYQLVEKINEDSIVRYARPDYPMLTTSFQPNDPFFRDQWYLQNTGQTIESYLDGNISSTLGKDIKMTRAWGLLNSLQNNALADKVVAVIDVFYCTT